MTFVTLPDGRPPERLRDDGAGHGVVRPEQGSRFALEDPAHLKVDLRNGVGREPPELCQDAVPDVTVRARGADGGTDNAGADADAQFRQVRPDRAVVGHV